MTAAYVPTRLTPQDYPASGAGGPTGRHRRRRHRAARPPISSSVSDRYRNLANFVDAFFTRFQTLLEPGHHPKWREVNLAAELPGWRRFPPAEHGCKRNAQVAATPIARI